MNTRRIYAIFLRYMLLLRSNPQRWVQIFIWGSLDVILWGFLTRYLNVIGGAEFSFVPVFLGAIILIEFLARVQQGVATPVLEDIWSNNLLNYFASPLKVVEYILGLISSSVVTSTLSIIAMTLLASTVFGFSFTSVGGYLIGFLAILFIFGCGFGIIAAGIVLRWGPSAEWFVWPMVAVLSPFVGVLYPLSVLPPWMQTIGYLLPPSYVFEGLRGITLGTGYSETALWSGLGLSVFYLIFSAFVFIGIHRSVVKKGLLARYSAESL